MRFKLQLSEDLLVIIYFILFFILLFILLYTIANYFLANISTQIPNYPFKGISHFIQAFIVPRIEPRRYKWFVWEPKKLHLGVGASGTSGKLTPTTNDLAFQDGDIATIQGLLGYLSCERDSYVVHLTLGEEGDNLVGLYNIESLVLAKKGRNKKATLVKTVPIKIEKGQKGLAQKKIKKEVDITVCTINIIPCSILIYYL